MTSSNTARLCATLSDGVQGPFAFAWSNAAITPCIDAIPGSYTVTVTDKTTGCSNRTTTPVVVSVAPALMSSLTAACTVVDTNVNAINLNATISGGIPPYTYTLTNTTTGVQIAADKSADGNIFVTIPNVGSKDSGIYEIKGTDSCNIPFKADSSNVMVPDSTIQVDVCDNNPVTLEGPAGPFTYKWSTNDTTRTDNGKSAI